MTGIHHTVLIPLTQGKIAVVDFDDYHLVKDYRWNATPTDGKWYARSGRKINGKQTAMHRFLLNAQPGEYVDHRDGNTLNNRRSNIRRCTPSQNHQNKSRQSNNRSSRYKGVSYCKRDMRWTANIQTTEGKRISRGAINELEAAKLYNRLASEHYGDFARLNLIEEAWRG